MTDFDEKYLILRRKFLQRCQQDLETIRAERDPERLRPVVHRLAGAAGTFGFKELSAEAGAVDDLLMLGNEPSSEALEHLAETLERSTAEQA